ncbi:hypothetical protein, partial [Streptomyces sp. MBT65]|uniref:hypothetical protein n=1 Tax=Streptomyces sp. MBT65 TaxID=1488395 RepID=UPI001F274C50
MAVAPTRAGADPEEVALPGVQPSGANSSPQDYCRRSMPPRASYSHAAAVGNRAPAQALWERVAVRDVHHGVMRAARNVRAGPLGRAPEGAALHAQPPGRRLDLPEHRLPHTEVQPHSTATPASRAWAHQQTTHEPTAVPLHRGDVSGVAPESTTLHSELEKRTDLPARGRAPQPLKVVTRYPRSPRPHSQSRASPNRARRPLRSSVATAAAPAVT